MRYQMQPTDDERRAVSREAVANPYDHRSADRLEDYVRKRFAGVLKGTAFHLYFACRFLECRQGIEPGGIILANVLQWRDAAGVSRNVVSNGLRMLARMGLVEHISGESVINGPATKVRRLTLAELKGARRKAEDVD